MATTSDTELVYRQEDGSYVHGFKAVSIDKPYIKDGQTLIPFCLYLYKDSK